MINLFQGWLLGIINGIDTKNLFNMIKENDFPILVDYELPSYLYGIKEIITENKDEILLYINYDAVMKYGHDFRPDLLKLLEHPKGKKWLERFLKTVYFVINNVELSQYEMQDKFYKAIAAIKANRGDNDTVKNDDLASKLDDINEEPALVEETPPPIIEAELEKVPVNNNDKNDKNDKNKSSLSDLYF